MRVFVKEAQIAGLDTTFGYANRIENPLATRTAACIRVAVECGCVPFVRTNTPQGLISFNCSNPVYGLTTHPLDATRTPGGSSGGEAALMACGGTPLGIGTDGGGSIRIPASFCGLTGIKVGHFCKNSLTFHPKHLILANDDTRISVRSG